MLLNIRCEDLEKEYFDEIKKETTTIRNEECEHFDISISLTSGYHFEELLFKITCKLCNDKENFEKNDKEYTQIYSCPKCKTPQIYLYYKIFEEINNNNNNDFKDGKEDDQEDKKENVQINIHYNERSECVTFNLYDSFNNQYYKIFEIFGINEKKDLYFNSTKLDIYKSLKDNQLYDNCDIEIFD